MGQINRRAALLGAAVSTAALAVPGVAVVNSEAKGFEDFLKNGTPEQLIDYHLMQLAKAMNRQSPGLWRAYVNKAGTVAMIHRDLSDKTHIGVVRQF